MKYIGIRGHRGSGKSTIAHLLGMCIEHLEQKRTFDDEFDAKFDEVVAKIAKGGDLPDNFNYVFFDKFADIPIQMVSLIFGVPMDMCYDDKAKDTYYLNLKDFSITEDPHEGMTAAQVFLYFRNKSTNKETFSPSVITTDMWVSIRELISYFGNYVMKSFFGKNVWVKSLDRTPEFEIGAGYHTNYKIFDDIKFVAEEAYINKKGGVVVIVAHEGHKKDNYDTSTDLTNNGYDYSIYYTDICDVETREGIKNTATMIYRRFNR